MKETNNFDAGSFESEVLMALEDLYQMDIPDWISNHRGAPELYTDVVAYDGSNFGIPKFFRFKWFSKKYKETELSENKIKKEIEENAREAESLLKRKDILAKKICPALSRATDDAFSIARSVTPVLTTISITGAAVIPLNPLFVALVALMLARMGIATVCGNLNSKDKND
jgi:hypothetical protein